MLSPYGRRKGSGLSIVVNAVHTLVAVMNEERLLPRMRGGMEQLA